jgi:hypothetical protein
MAQGIRQQLLPVSLKSATKLQTLTLTGIAKSYKSALQNSLVAFA